MNKFLMTTFLMIASIAGFSQSNMINPFPRTINVNGSAEMEIVPDEIYVQVTLREYQNKGASKVSIDKIREDFLSKFKTLGLPDSAISILDYDGYNGNPWLKKKKKDPSLLASISYQIKLRTAAQMDKLVGILDDDATANFQIIKTSHSRLEEYRKQLKIQAIQAAKQKAIYLAAAVDETIGQAVTINEPNDSYVPMYRNLTFANAKMATADGEDSGMQVDWKKMKIKMDVNITFALK